MDLQFRIKINEKLFIRDPEATELGKKIVRQGIVLIHQLGFEDFTFKKLAERIGTTEASIYRYFENKHRLLVYLVTWYWNLLEFQVVFQLNNLTDPEQKIKKVIELLSSPIEDGFGGMDFDFQALYQIAVAESNKAYLTKDVTAHNKDQMFKPYKDLCARIAGLIAAYKPDYPFPRSLASTLVEMAHFQYFFMQNLPSLTDFGQEKDTTKLRKFLESMVL
jgi:AcrR family transcriptional regulator